MFARVYSLLDELAESWFRQCFVNYITTKVLKRLEANKIRGTFKEPPRTILLPISLGVSSITLLHILDEQIGTQLQRSSRASYKLHILYIAQSPVIEQAHHTKTMARLKERFPVHFYSSILLQDILDYDVNLEEEILKSTLPELKSSPADKHTRLLHLMSSLSSASSKTDLENVLRLRLSSAFARRHGYDTILYGDSTTRLAERTLSETAKGRGGSLPWLTADGTSPDGLRISYPMRDLLRKEIIAYSLMVSTPLTDLILNNEPPAPVSVLHKNNTIDNLMNQYFESVEQNYPSIVANVVRTSSKLIAPVSPYSSLACNICKLPIAKESRPWGGDQSSSIPPYADDHTVPRNLATLCYGCARLVQNAG